MLFEKFQEFCSFPLEHCTSMERQEMYSTSRCINHTYLCGSSKYPVSINAV